MAYDDADLGTLLDAIADEFGIGVTYAHARSGVRFVVVAVALEERSLAPVVVYRRADDPRLTWTRPAKEFRERFVRAELLGTNQPAAPVWCCKVCGATPDADGLVQHGRGCYQVDPDGGGTEWVG